mmetsp:Transcript_24746/g.54740  ORF Transcript_24746/g.54740 Transcript_24746/m.54740 type:complete len:878 (-) Transcript_24746:146-2779(-)
MRTATSLNSSTNTSKSSRSSPPPRHLASTGTLLLLGVVVLALGAGASLPVVSANGDANVNGYDVGRGNGNIDEAAASSVAHGGEGGEGGGAHHQKENSLLRRYLKKNDDDDDDGAELEVGPEESSSNAENNKNNKHKNKNKNKVVGNIADAATTPKDSNNNNNNKKHKDKHKDKNQSPADSFSSQSKAYEQQWQVYADQLFTCRHAPAVCNPDILKRLHYALLAAAKMHHDIWFVGGWILSMIGFVMLAAGIAISWYVDGSDGLGRRGTGHGSGATGSAGGGGKAAEQVDYQPISLQGTDDDDDDDDPSDENDDVDVESPTKDKVSRNHVLLPQSGMARYSAQFALFWNRRIARKDGGVGAGAGGTGSAGRRHGGGRRSKRSKKTNTAATKGGSEHFDDNEMTFLPPSTTPSKSASGNGGNAHFATTTPAAGNSYMYDSDSDGEEDDDDTSPSKLKRSPYHLEYGPNATSLSAIVKRIPSNLMQYWTNTTLYFVQPLLSFKIFLAFLLFVELNEIMAPEQSMLATPEVVKLIRTYPKHHEYVNPYVQWIMPGLVSEDVDGGQSVEGWVRTLEVIRFVLISSWFAFLLCPKKYLKVVGGSCYGVGAVLYVYLGVIGLMYDLAHSTQGGMLFILSAIPAVPFLETSHRANHWLRKFLYVGIWVPLYLFSGISKFRYLGIIPNMTGSWLWGDFGHGKLHRAVWKSLYTYIGSHKFVMFIFSWGNILLEIILPMVLLFYNEIRLVQWLFHFVAIMFHVTIFLLLGPNFTRYCLMHLYAVDILSYFPRFANGTRRSTVSSPTKLDWGLVIYTVLILMAWWYVQFQSDIMHLIGMQDWKTRINSYWPIPELSMFAKPKDSANVYIAFVFTLLSFVCLVLEMVR